MGWAIIQMATAMQKQWPRSRVSGYVRMAHSTAATATPASSARARRPRRGHVEQGGGVGADGEEHLRAEVELARPAADDVPANAEHRVDEHQEADRLVVRLALQLERGSDRRSPPAPRSPARSAPR